MKPSKACLACSTLFSANVLISGGISKRSVPAMVVSYARRQGVMPAGVLVVIASAAENQHPFSDNASRRSEIPTPKTSIRSRPNWKSRNRVAERSVRAPLGKKSYAHRRYPGMCDSPQIQHKQFELRFFGNDDVRRRGGHRCDAGTQTGHRILF